MIRSWSHKTGVRTISLACGRPQFSLWHCMRSTENLQQWPLSTESAVSPRKKNFPSADPFSSEKCNTGKTDEKSQIHCELDFGLSVGHCAFRKEALFVVRFFMTPTFSYTTSGGYGPQLKKLKSKSVVFNLFATWNQQLKATEVTS